MVKLRSPTCQRDESKSEAAIADTASPAGKLTEVSSEDVGTAVSRSPLAQSDAGEGGLPPSGTSNASHGGFIGPLLPTDFSQAQNSSPPAAAKSPKIARVQPQPKAGKPVALVHPVIPDVQQQDVSKNKMKTIGEAKVSQRRDFSKNRQNKTPQTPLKSQWRPVESPASDQPDPGKMFHPEPRKEKEPSGHNTLCEMKKKGKHGKVNKLAGRVGHSEESEDSHSKSSEEESSEEDERPRKKKKRRRHDGWKEKHRSKHRIHTQDSDFSGSEEEEWQRHHRHRASNHREPHREGDRYEEERNKVSHKKERWYGHHHHYLTDGQPVKRSRQQQQSPSPDRSQRKHRRSYSESDSGPEEQRRHNKLIKQDSHHLSKWHHQHRHHHHHHHHHHYGHRPHLGKIHKVRHVSGEMGERRPHYKSSEEDWSRRSENHYHHHHQHRHHHHYTPSQQERREENEMGGSLTFSQDRGKGMRFHKDPRRTWGSERNVYLERASERPNSLVPEVQWDSSLLRDKGRSQTLAAGVGWDGSRGRTAVEQLTSYSHAQLGSRGIAPTLCIG